MKLPFLLFACLAAPLAATPLHKCVGANGVASYKDTPCASDQHTAWVRDALPDAVPARPTAVVSPPRRRATARTAVVPARVASKAAPSRCEMARRAADDARDREWNRLSFRQRSELDDRVARACRRR